MSVYLVGAGPGSRDLLTLRAARLLESADVVVHDRLVDASVLELVPARARRIDVGKRWGQSECQEQINRQLIDLSRRFDLVVRLKGGDPFLFGRGGEEWAALHDAGVDVEVVPGVTSAFAAPLAAGIPVTHRGVSQGVVVVAGQLSRERVIDLVGLAREDLTLVILMGVAARAQFATTLIAGGRSPDTPVAVVQGAWTSNERTTRATLGELGGLDVVAPAVIVVGSVATLAFGDRERVGEVRAT